MTDRPTLSPQELETWKSFYSMRRTLDRALDLQLQRDSSISASEYEILLAIDNATDRRLRITDIAAAIGWEKSRVSHLIARMEKRALVDRIECDTDARSSWIGLTPAGRRAVLGAMRGHVAAIRQYFLDVLDENDADRLSQISHRVMSAIGCGADEDAPVSPRIPASATEPLSGSLA